MQSDFYKIIYKFGFDNLYTKKEIIDGLKEMGIIEDKKGLLNKIKSAISFRKTYQHENRKLEFMYIKGDKLYRIVTWEKGF